MPIPNVVVLLSNQVIPLHLTKQTPKDNLNAKAPTTNDSKVPGLSPPATPCLGQAETVNQVIRAPCVKAQFLAPSSSALRIVCVFAFAGLFALGETVMAPTVTPLVNSLADDRVRGRANALSSAAYSVAFVVSPAVSTGLIAAGLSVLWLGLLVAGCLGTAVLGSRLGRRSPPRRTGSTLLRSPAAPPRPSRPRRDSAAGRFTLVRS